MQKVTSTGKRNYFFDVASKFHCMMAGYLQNLGVDHMFKER